MGPGDRFMKWILIAKMLPPDDASKIGVGSLVYHPTKKEGNQDSIGWVINAQVHNNAMCISLNMPCLLSRSIGLRGKMRP